MRRARRRRRRAEDRAATVEDELVLAADEIAVGDGAEAVARARREHLLARLALAEVVGEAEMLSTQAAPSAAASATASGSQMSSQIVSASAPPGVSMCSEPRPGENVRSSSKTP